MILLFVFSCGIKQIFSFCSLCNMPKQTIHNIDADRQTASTLRSCIVVIHSHLVKCVVTMVCYLTSWCVPITTTLLTTNETAGKEHFSCFICNGIILLSNLSTSVILLRSDDYWIYSRIWGTLIDFLSSCVSLVIQYIVYEWYGKFPITSTIILFCQLWLCNTSFV